MPKPENQKTPPPTASGSQKKYAEADEYIDFQIRKTQVGVKRNDLTASCTLLIAFALGYLLLFALFDQWLIPNGFRSPPDGFCSCSS